MRNICFDRFPGAKKGVDSYGPAGAAKATEDDDDDDIDLFGSDDEDDEEAEKLKQERVKAYQEKKSTSIYSTSVFEILNALHLVAI